MRILFLTVYNIKSLEQNGLYEDLLNEFVKRKHKVTIVTPSKEDTSLTFECGYELLKVKASNFQKTNIVKKGIASLLLPLQFKKAIKDNIDFNEVDLILYSTPPITIAPVVAYLKRNMKASTFLLLKDIWPQAIVDIGAIRKSSIVYQYFRLQEKKLYRISDEIGCTSQANIDYVVSHNNISESKLAIVTNGLSGDVMPVIIDNTVREKYKIPLDKKVFFYGGNLGLPQDIQFVTECFKECAHETGMHFVICGAGTQSYIIKDYYRKSGQDNLTILDYLPQEEYERMVAASDVCMVFLNHAFTVPNCPARFYTYMKYGKPILACTDKATDIQSDIIKGNFGWWCESTDSCEFYRLTKKACDCDLLEKGRNARAWFEQYYTTEITYQTITDSLKGIKK